MTWFHVESINYPSTEGTPLHYNTNAANYLSTQVMALQGRTLTVTYYNIVTSDQLLHSIAIL